jgi:hypothetical protein
MSTIVGTNIEVTNIKYDSDTTSMIISNAGQVTVQGEGTATTNLQGGLAKVYLLHNDGTTMTSINIGSITDHGTGDFTYNFTNAFNALGRYTISGFVSNNNSQVGTHSMNTSDEETNAGSARINTGYIQNTNGGTALLDCNNSSLILHGDLA